MGLDQTLCRTTKKCKKAKEAFAILRSVYDKRVEELYSTEKWKNIIDGLPKDKYGYLDPKSFSPEQKKQVSVWRRNLHRIAKSIGIQLDNRRRPWFNPATYGLKGEELDEPIAEWRKYWELHQFIVDNFLEDKEHDNLVPIYLTKADCEKIVAAGFEGGFHNALDRWDDEHEVFYWAWY